jgi:hypothetical protein
MTHELDPEGRPARPVEPIDDRTLAALVRDVAEEWRMPPQRLNAPTWRDQVERGGRAGSGHGWLARLTGATTLAIVATVALSLVAVWLTLPRAQVSTGKSPAPSGSVRTPGITPGPIASALPKLTVNGDPPSVTSMLLHVGGDFAIADLTTGTLGQRITGTYGNSDVLRLSDGRLVCLCMATDAVINGAYSHALVSWQIYDRTGQLTGSRPIAEYTGVPDPRPGVSEDQPPHVDVLVSFSPDGRLGFVGWSLRKPPVWKSGLVVVDLAAGNVIKRLALPDESTGPANSTMNVLGARVMFSPDGGHAVVSRSKYWIERPSGTYHGLTDLFRGASDGRSLDPSPILAPTSQCGNGSADAAVAAVGIASDGRVWLLCWANGGGQFDLRRIGSDGSVLGDTPVDAGGEGGVWTPTRDGTGLYVWSAVARTISRIDLRTGEKTSTTAPAPTSSTGVDPLRAFGRWLAPGVAAKVFLQPGLVLSPDGSKLYALGIAGGSADFMGSAGVFVFDAASLAPLDHWAPQADYISMALSADGRFVYAIGAPGVDPAGHQSAYGSSITVYDAADGSIRLQAGQLEHDDMQFLAPILR